MNTGSREFATFVLERLAPLPQLAASRFFGGIAIRSRGTLFAMIMDSALYFATDATTRAEYEASGSRCFSFAKQGKVVHTKFFEVPAEVLDDTERLVPFALKAIAVVQARSAARKPKRATEGGGRGLR